MRKYLICERKRSLPAKNVKETSKKVSYCAHLNAKSSEKDSQTYHWLTITQMSGLFLKNKNRNRCIDFIQPP